MAGTGFSSSSTASLSSSTFPFSSSAAASPSSLFASIPASSSSSAFSFSFSNPTSTSTSAPSSSPSFSLFGASTTSSSSASSTSSFGFASSTATASSASSPLFGSSSSGSGFPSGIFGSASSASTASSTGSPLFGTSSFGSGAAASSPFGAFALFGSSTPSSASGSTNLFGSGSSGSLFGSTAASSPFGSSSPSPTSGFGATPSASTSPFSSGLFSSSSSSFGVSSSVSTASVPSFPSLVSSASSGLGSVPSTPAFSFHSGTSSVSSVPSFAPPVSSAASSTTTASGFSFPATTPASSASLGQAFSFPTTSSASSASSAPSFSFSLSSGSSAASSSFSPSPFSASSASAFSFSKGTGSSPATAISASAAPSLSSLSSALSAASSAGFSFGTSGFQTSASAPAFSATPAPKPSFGTTTSPLFSTVTTTTSASTPAATTAASASTSGTGLASNIPALGPAASSAATAASTSGSADASSGFTGFSVSAHPGTTTATTSSFSLSTKLPATGSSTQPQPIAAAPISGALVSLAGKSSGSSTFCLRIDEGDEDEVQGEGEQVREGVLEQPLVESNNFETNHNEFSMVGQDQGGKSDSVKDGGGVEQESKSYSVASGITIHFKELEAIQTVVPGAILLSTSSVESASLMGDTLGMQPAMGDLGKQQPSQDVAEGQEKTSENSSVVSENHNEFSAVGQDQGGKIDSAQDVGVVEQDCKSSAFACSAATHVKELEATPDIVPAETILLSNSSVASALVTGDTPNIQPAVVDMGKEQPSKDVAEGQEETSETSSDVSEVAGDEVGISNAMGQAFSVFSHCSGLTNLTISPSDAQMIVRNIFDKHGDITKGSVVKSLVIRSTLLRVVTELVHRLRNHTMNSLCSDEMQLMQSLAEDVAAVGFSVDWLLERLKKVSAAFKYHECCVHLERLGEQINAAKKSLMEMELQQLVWKNEVDCLKVELEGIDFEGSNLGVPALASTTAATSSASSAAQTSSLVVSSRSGTTSSTTTAVLSAPKLPSEITGKTVEEIIKEWNTELQERTRKFQKQANAIAEWDKRILQNRDILLRLETDVAKVVETQANLERQLELIETHQDEVDKALQSIEEEAERIYKDERGLLLDDEAASTRDAMYEQAEFIERELEHMTEQIKAIINTLNTSQVGELEATDGMSPLDVVVRILNNQLSSLMWIDEKAEEFSSRIQKLASQGSVVDREIMSPKFWLT